MKQPWTNRDLRTLRILAEYGFSDAECADHLGVSPIAVRQMRQRLGVAEQPGGSGLLRARDVARRAGAHHPTQARLGGRSRHAGPVILRMVDDRVAAAT